MPTESLVNLRWAFASNAPTYGQGYSLPIFLALQNDIRIRKYVNAAHLTLGPICENDGRLFTSFQYNLS